MPFYVPGRLYQSDIYVLMSFTELQWVCEPLLLFTEMIPTSLQCLLVLSPIDFIFWNSFLRPVVPISVPCKLVASGHIKAPHYRKVKGSFSLAVSSVAISHLFNFFPFLLIYDFFLLALLPDCLITPSENVYLRQVIWRINYSFPPLWKPSLPWWTLAQKVRPSALLLFSLNIICLTWHLIRFLLLMFWKKINSYLYYFQAAPQFLF